MRTLVTVTSVTALFLAQALPFAWANEAMNVCTTQVAHNGSATTSLTWQGVPVWQCHVKQNSGATTKNIGWYPAAAPLDK